MPAFSTRLTVTIGDVNYGGHVGNEVFLLFFQEARLRFLAQWGWSEKDIGGAALIMTEASVKYLAQLGHGDELDVRVSVAELKGLRFTLAYEVLKTDGTKAATGTTKLCAFDYTTGKVARLPDAFAGKLGELAGG